MVEVGRVGGSEGLLLAAVEAGGELDGGVGAGAEVEVGLAGAELAQLAELLGAGGGVALVLCNNSKLVDWHCNSGADVGWRQDVP